MQTANLLPYNITSKITEGDGNKQGTDLANPFELGDKSKDENNYRLASSSPCINAGLNEPAGAIVAVDRRRFCRPYTRLYH